MITIQKLRYKIDKIDADIIKKLSQRKNLSIQIGHIKSQCAKQVIDNKREEKMFIHFEKLCSEYQLHPSFIKKLFKIIISNSRKLQK